MFDNCSNFQIFGGTFHHQDSPTAPARGRDVFADDPGFPQNFRFIQLGDLDLLEEICKENIVEYREIRRRKTKPLVRRERRVVGKRKICQVRVPGRPGTLTAVLYKGTEFEKWRTEAEKHETFRDPSLVQLYAVTVSRALNALIYTDRKLPLPLGTDFDHSKSAVGLIPLRDVRELHVGSPLAATYVEYGIKRDLYAAFEYWQSTTGTWLLSPGAPNYTSWIRVSTGRLCIDVGESFSDIKHLDVKSLVRDPVSRATSIGYCETGLVSRLVSCLHLDDIHVMLCSRSGYEMTEVTFRSGHVALGTIWPTSDVREVIGCLDLLRLPTPIGPQDIVRQPWSYWDNGLKTPCSPKDVMPNGWRRVTLPPNMQNAHHLTTRMKIQTSKRREMQKCWLSQANSILCAHSNKDVRNCWIPGGVKFRISIWYPEDNCALRGTFMTDTPSSEIYLFIFRPHVEFLAGYPVINVPQPREALYWSFDPRGKTKMTSEMAEKIGVPYVFFESWVTGTSWSQKDYNILAEFHRTKGFDPFSRKVAAELGYPILGPKVASHTSLSEIDEIEVEYAKREMKTYPKQGFRRGAVRCPDCGGGQPAVQNVVLPDVEVPPIHRHRKYRNVFIRADTTMAG
ncbi:hypothetical protein MVEN_01307400 [Mycena venus]|uniref:Uncharacterized protein n=1 Tax=Mycena venus TaxID=2733690 RepID=A0A8H6XZR3_9AGAR|nr:hypothetical protein MVEN_01307400 [Mycena venus]